MRSNPNVTCNFVPWSVLTIFGAKQSLFTKGKDRLTELQEQLSLPKHKLLSDCPTRWNSIYYMLAQLLEQKPATTVMLTKLLYMRKSGKKLPKISEVNNQEISPVRHT